MITSRDVGDVTLIPPPCFGPLGNGPYDADPSGAHVIFWPESEFGPAASYNTLIGDCGALTVLDGGTGNTCQEE